MNRDLTVASRRSFNIFASESFFPPIFELLFQCILFRFFFVCVSTSCSNSSIRFSLIKKKHEQESWLWNVVLFRGGLCCVGVFFLLISWSTRRNERGEWNFNWERQRRTCATVRKNWMRSIKKAHRIWFVSGRKENNNSPICREGFYAKRPCWGRPEWRLYSFQLEVRWPSRRPSTAPRKSASNSSPMV